MRFPVLFMAKPSTGISFGLSLPLRFGRSAGWAGCSATTSQFTLSWRQRLTLLLAVAYFACCSKILNDDPMITWIPPLGVFLALTYGQIGGDPLPSGGYTPAALLGALFLVVGVVSSISGSAALTGLACGLAIVTKHDCWLPSAAVLALLAVRRRYDGKVAIACTAVVVTAVAAVVVCAGRVASAGRHHDGLRQG